MKNTKTIYECQTCGFQSPKWAGRCPECDSWNTFIEEILKPSIDVNRKVSVTDVISPSVPMTVEEIAADDVERIETGISEFDRVLGGGIVRGGAVLFGGDPGIGKSTLLLQLSDLISKSDKVLYISGEESLNQIKLRADRIGIRSKNLFLLNETNLESIISNIEEVKPDLVVIDSIQVIYSSTLSQSPGTLTQVKECACVLTALAKAKNIAVFIIGHINKEGAIAGPKILEHIVDSVIFFEGERRESFRILRAMKNRFGPINEIGVFEMANNGLNEVRDPSMHFISNRGESLIGSALISTLEGIRSLIVEIQALVSASNFGMPRQRSTGFDINRMVLKLAVIEKNLGFNFSNYDVFLNVIGGIKINEPASDLGMCLAIVSSFREKPLFPDTVFIGEVGLTSEVRGVSQIESRIKEVFRLGLKRCVVPSVGTDKLEETYKGRLIRVSTLKQAVAIAFSDEKIGVKS